MSIATSDELLEDLRRYHLLTPKQANELAAQIADKNVAPRVLAQRLMQRGWLTPYQVNQLLRGLGKNLTLGHYILLERLGEGGMGEVFKARHVAMDRVAAIKLIHKERLADAAAVKRFHREIQAAAQLTHPNVVHAFDVDQVDGKHIFIMEYIEGTDLARLVGEKGPLAIDQACDYIRQAALGLQHAHEKGMVHRDIKPHNLLLGKNQVVKVLDLGMARVQTLEDSEKSTSTLTEEGTVMGTLDCIAPEQTRDAHTDDIRADVYSLGCSFYFLLTGKVPFPGGSSGEKIAKHLALEPPPVEGFRPDVPPGVAAVVRKMMAKQAQDRYQTPGEVAAELETIAGPGISTKVQTRAPNSTYHTGSRSRRRRLLPRIVLAGAGCIALLLVVLLVRGFSGSPEPSKKTVEPAKAIAPVPPPPPGSLEAIAPESREYELVYDLNLSRLGREIVYDDDRRTHITRPFDRIAYFIELRRAGGETQYLYVSLAAFTTDLRKIGVPTVASGASFQENVNSMNVYSNVSGIVIGEGLTGGNIEFWPNNYGPANAKKVPNADSGKYDFGDQMTNPLDGYGSMQIHNHIAKQTLFAVNHWSAGNRADIGIGNSSRGNPDWTFAGNAGEYPTRRLRVLVRCK